MTVPSWREGLPLLVTPRVVLRELRRADADTLFKLAHTPAVARYSWPGPPSRDAFERFITLAWKERTNGQYACFAITPCFPERLGGVPPGLPAQDPSHPAGIFELRSLQPQFFRAELGLLLDPALWENGLFEDGMRLVCGFAFETVGVRRIEVRISVNHAACNAALPGAGFQKEAVLRAAFRHGDGWEDQYLWARTWP